MLTRNLAFVLVALACSSLAAAAVFPVVADGADQTRRDDGSSIWVGQRSASIGYDSSARELSHIMPFQLPDLGGEAIASATLEMHAWDSAWGSSLSLDLYGVRWSSSATVEASDMYRGPWDDSGAVGEAIMQAYAVKASGNPAPVSERQVVTDAAASADLGAWLAGVYAAGAQPGDYVFLRVGPDTDYLSGSNSYIYFDTGNTTSVQSGGSTYVFNPTLTITTVPEPATLALLGLGVALIRRRR